MVVTLDHAGVSIQRAVPAECLHGEMLEPLLQNNEGAWVLPPW